MHKVTVAADDGVQVHVTDKLWTWSQRGVVTLVAVGSVLWYLFQWYNGVEGLKTKVDALWTGQEGINKTLVSLNASIDKLSKPGVGAIHFGSYAVSPPQEADDPEPPTRQQFRRAPAPPAATAAQPDDVDPPKRPAAKPDPTKRPR
jgi:hypothetical protein